MRFGIALGRLNPTAWIEATRCADDLGYDFVSMPEHLVLPVRMNGSPTGASHPPIEPDLPVFDVWVYFAHLAAVTTRIRFGSYVYNLGLRHPFSTARAVATADVLSAGRIEVGLGVGWLAEEWAAVGLAFHDRAKRFEEALEICRRLWTEPIIEHHGEHFDFDPVMFEPKPSQAAIPLLFGGDAPATIRRCVRFGGGWVPLKTPDELLAPAISDFRARWADAGNDPAAARVVRAVRAIDATGIDRMVAAGVTDLVVAPWTRSSEAIDAIARFAGLHLPDRQLPAVRP